MYVLTREQVVRLLPLELGRKLDHAILSASNEVLCASVLKLFEDDERLSSDFNYDTPTATKFVLQHVTYDFQCHFEFVGRNNVIVTPYGLESHALIRAKVCAIT